MKTENTTPTQWPTELLERHWELSWTDWLNLLLLSSSHNYWMPKKISSSSRFPSNEWALTIFQASQAQDFCLDLPLFNYVTEEYHLPLLICMSSSKWESSSSVHFCAKISLNSLYMWQDMLNLQINAPSYMHQMVMSQWKVEVESDLRASSITGSISQKSSSLLLLSLT
jgi:hypothetical protein